MTRRYKVIFRREAAEHLSGIYRYIASESGEARASAFTQAIVSFCRSLETFPKRGTARDHIRPSLRFVGFRRSVTIAFRVRERQVTILAIIYRGQDAAAVLRGIPD